MKRFEKTHAISLLALLMWLLAFTMWPAGTEAQQQLAFDRRPRFMVPERGSGKPVEVDITRVGILRRRVALNRSGATVLQLLHEISAQAGLEFAYEPEIIPVSRVVGLRADSITIAAALTEILVDAGVDVLLKSSQQAVLLKRALPGSITGRITDAKTGMGVAGAEVFLSNTRWRTSTDTGGRYRLVDVEPENYTLVVRRLGYGKQSRAVVVREEPTDTINIAMEQLATRLDEVITTANGQRRRMDIANDVTTINADSVMQVAPIRSVTELLESRVPGLTVQRTSGAPGDPARLRLRGVASPLRNNDPIVIVDGIRIYAEQSADRSANLARQPTVVGGVDTIVTAGYTSATPSPLDYLDPNSIETIEVFKGPSAATMYGQDAANGVIVITTKRGKAGPTRWTGSVEHGRTQMASTKYPTLYLRWGHRQYDGGADLCPVTNFIFPLGEEPCVGDSILTFQLLNDPTLTVLDRGHRSAFSLGTSGGTQAVTYSVIGSYADELGLVKLPSYEADRYQALLGVPPPVWMQRPLNLKEWRVTTIVGARLGATADVTLRASVSRTEQQKSALLDQLGDLMSTYLDRSSGLYYQGSGEGGFFPVPTALRGYFERATDHVTAFSNGLTASWRPRPWLLLNADAGLNLSHRSDNIFFPRGPANSRFGYQGASGVNDTTGYVNDGQGTALVSTVNLRALAQRLLGRGFQLQFALGANYNGTSTNDVAGGSSDLAPGSSLQGRKITFLNRAEVSSATFGWYLEPSVGNSKLNFTSGLRLDGGSGYGANVSGFKLPTFPRLGFSYLVSDERWFPLKNLVQSLRLRVAYGRASRQPGPTDRLRLYDLPGQMFADSQFRTAIMLQTLGNPDVRPERSAEFEGGFDADLLESRLRLGFTGYRKSTADALLNVPVGPSVYGDAVTTIKNIGVTRNTGLSLTVGADLVRSRPLTWTVQLWLDQRRDVVVSLAPGLEPFYTNGNKDYGGQRVVTGYPLDGRWSRPIVGYGDANGDGALALSEIQIGDTAIYLGNTLPNYQASLNSSISLWHGAVTVNVGFSYEDGLTQENQMVRNLAIFSAGRQVPGTSLAEQAATIDLRIVGPDFTGVQGLSPSTNYNWVQTVNTLRFNELGVSYAVPTNVAHRLGAQSLALAVQGRNLGLHTNYRGLDPNVNAFGTGSSITDIGVLPQPRTWQLRVNATY